MAFYHCTIFGQYACGANFSLGNQGGKKEHTLVTDELPSMQLTLWHSGGSGQTYFSRPIGINGGGGSTEISHISTSGITKTGYADIKASLPGKSRAINLLPPYLVQCAHVHT